MKIGAREVLKDKVKITRWIFSKGYELKKGGRAEKGGRAKIEVYAQYDFF